MAKGDRSPSESRRRTDQWTGARVRQITACPAIHHHPFFMVPAYDDAMRRLLFVSHRTGSPQLFVEERSSGELIQLTDRPDLNSWSIYPSHDGETVFFTAGSGAWRLNFDTLEEEELVNLTAARLRETGMVAAAMGTTALSHDDRWWAVRSHDGEQSVLTVIDTRSGNAGVILRRDSISHLQFCPDDAGLLYYAGPLTDRVWVIHRDGTGNRRLYQRRHEKQWITHESWIPGTRELAFVDWPHGLCSVHVDTGVERRLTSFNAWHAVCNRSGTRMVADTNFPDIGLQVFDPRDGVGRPITLCRPYASSLGEHWKTPFPYNHRPIAVYAPQHTHPHPSFSPDGQWVVYTSDRSGYSQIYEVEVPSS